MPENIKFLLWLAFHHSVPSKEVLCHRGMLRSSICAPGNQEQENFLHLVRDCTLSQPLWLTFGFVQRNSYDVMDNQTWIKDGVEGDKVHICLSIQELLRHAWTENILHTLLEGNMCADILAKMGSSQDNSMQIFEVAPSSLSLALHADALGTFFLRV